MDWSGRERERERAYLNKFYLKARGSENNSITTIHVSIHVDGLLLEQRNLGIGALEKDAVVSGVSQLQRMGWVPTSIEMVSSRGPCSLNMTVLKHKNSSPPHLTKKSNV